MAHKAYKFRIYPNEEQKVFFAKTFGCVRFVYNRWLNRKIKQYEQDNTYLSFYNSSKELTELKKDEEFAFLREVDSVALQQALRHLDNAFQNFFKQPKTGFPRFKSRKKNKNSYSTMFYNNNIYFADEFIKLPKVGLVKIKQHRNIPNNYTLKSVTVSQTPSGKYYASVLFEYEEQIRERPLEKFLGLDFSPEELYTDSNGDVPAYPKYYRQAEKKLKQEQHKLNRMKKGSKNRDKQRIRLAQIHEKITNQRKDFLHKLSRQITNACDCVCVPNLDMIEMAQSQDLSKSIADNGWGTFVRLLEYKLADQGKRLVKVDKELHGSAVNIMNEGMQIALA